MHCVAFVLTEATCAEEAAFIIDPGEGNEHKPGDIVEDQLQIGNESYKVRTLLAHRTLQAL